MFSPTKTTTPKGTRQPCGPGAETALVLQHVLASLQHASSEDNFVFFLEATAEALPLLGLAQIDQKMQELVVLQLSLP